MGEPANEREKSFTKLMEQHAMAFSERLTLQTREDFIYLSDVETYELYLISAKDPRQIHESFGDYQGRRCYEVLQGRDAPCPFCTNDRITADRYYIWQYHNPIMDRDYVLQDTLVPYNGRLVRMEVVHDVNTPELARKVMTGALESQNLMMSCIQPLVYETQPETAMKKMLERACGYFGASHGFIHCFSCEPMLVEWSVDGGAGDVQVVPPSEETAGRWAELLTDGGQIVLKDVAVLAGENPRMFEALKRSGISSLCTTPLMLNQNLIGLMSLDNIQSHWEDLSILNLLAAQLAGLIHKRQLEEENRNIQFFDQLTGCRSFAGFRRDAAALLERRDGAKYSLWYCDIKNFKYINDVLGYAAGDRLLCYWAELLSDSMAERECFGRVTADNFVMLARYDNREELVSRFQALCGKLTDFEQLETRCPRIELVAGIYLMECDGDILNMDEMLDRANMAQKSIKQHNRRRICFYTEEKRQEAVRQLQMERDMPEAVRKEEFILCYQPQVCVQTEGPDRLPRAEALIRWMKEGKIYASPTSFISLFEHNGMVVELDHYVMEHVCAFLRSRREQGLPAVCISVNVSRITMLQPGFVKTYCALKERYGVEDGTIELEFTENIAVLNFGRFQKAVLELQAHGFQCAMDDFGTAQSSLNVLQRLPLDVLKLDRAFFQNLFDTKRADVVLAHVLHMAGELGMTTVAEGVEDERQAARLKALGCGYIQSFLYSKPLTQAEFERRIQEGTK